MTIAAGFVNRDGVLLCADTMTTDGGTSVIYRSKIIPVYFNDGKAFFAFAGEVKFIESVVQRCENALCRYNGGLRSGADIAEVVRKQWIAAFRESHNPKDGLSGDQILCAIHSERDKRSALYNSSNQSFAMSGNDVECIGWGEAVARYLVGQHMPSGAIRELNQRRVFETAISALGRVKEFMPHAVGGNLTAVRLNSDGSEYLYGQYEIEKVETYTAEFDDLTREMLGHFANLDKPGTFNAEADRIIAEIKGVREQWEGSFALPLSDSPPMEILDAFEKAKAKY